MESGCDCSDWQDLIKSGRSIVKLDPVYSWILNWVELTEEKGYTQVHRYGMSIRYCPMCGKKLT